MTVPQIIGYSFVVGLGLSLFGGPAWGRWRDKQRRIERYKKR